jgi:hypothetical protein
MSQQMFFLNKPIADEKIAPAELSYSSARLRLQLHDLILSAFAREGISQKDLAVRLNKNQAQISRLLGAPGNWTIETAAHLLYGISGNCISVQETDPREGVRRNDTKPEWLINERIHAAASGAKNAILHHDRPSPAGHLPLQPTNLRFATMTG